MQIHFVAYQIEISQMVWGDKGASSLEELHDPIEGVRDFAKFFNQIDLAGSDVPTLIIDTAMMRRAFWRREDFLMSLRQLCLEDVYVQSQHWHQIKLCFLLEEDRVAVEQRLMQPRSEILYFHENLRQEIIDFLHEIGERRIADFYELSRPSGFAIEIRSPEAEMLVKTKFR